MSALRKGLEWEVGNVSSTTWKTLGTILNCPKVRWLNFTSGFHSLYELCYTAKMYRFFCLIGFKTLSYYTDDTYLNFLCSPFWSGFHNSPAPGFWVLTQVYGTDISIHVRRWMLSYLKLISPDDDTCLQPLGYVLCSRQAWDTWDLVQHTEGRGRRYGF